MKVRLLGSLALIAGLALVYTAGIAGELKSGPEKRFGGSFNVKAITGEQKGKTLCYV